MIKGVRHCLQLNLLPTTTFGDQCIRYYTLLKDVAPERIKAELGKIYSHPYVSHGVQMLQKYRLLAPLLSEDAERHVTINALAVCRVVTAGGRFQDMADETLRQCVEEEWPLYAP